MYGELIRTKLKYVPPKYMFVYRFYDNWPSLEPHIECCLYREGTLVSTVRFPYEHHITEEELDTFLELSSDYQKMPGVHRCPCEVK